jgi:hypothetical protein
MPARQPPATVVARKADYGRWMPDDVVVALERGGIGDIRKRQLGYRTRLWKTDLAALAAGTGLTITVCHLPPGTSKWNKIEHRLFSHISMNWRGRPLTTHDVIVQGIAAVTTSTGLTVHAELDNSSTRPA